MASNYEAVSSWRLRSNNGSVPLKFLGLSGSFEKESGSIEFKALIPAEYMIQFLEETFPPPIMVGNMSIPQSSSLPGLPTLLAKKVTFKSQDDALPIDPFGFDAAAGAGTYYPVLEVVVEYGMDRLQEPNPQDPTTFLEISCQGHGEFIHTTVPTGKWQHKRENPDDVKPDSTEPAVDYGPRKPPVVATVPTAAAGSTQTTEPVKDPTVSTNILCPLTDWTIKWKQIPYTYFHNTVIYRLRWALGHVNSLPFFPIMNAEEETILFLKYNYTESYTWRSGVIGKPPIDLELHFIEKRNVWNGMVCGHNHQWMPGKGWTYLLVNGKTIEAVAATNRTAYDAWVTGGRKGSPPARETGGPSYQSRDLNCLFRV